MKKSKILIKNIKELFVTEDQPVTFIKGQDMQQVSSLKNAYVAIEGDVIVDFGPMSELHGITDWSNLSVIDADGKMVMPSFIDSHTHLIFAHSREGEFVDRISGLTYEQIAAKGGGILNSAKRLQETSEEELFESALERLNEIASYGTASVEIKSGYGLTPKAELKMLRVIKKLKENSPLTIKSTFLGAHAYPAEYKQNHEGYIQSIIEEMLPVINNENLADYIDCFCERNYYSKEELNRILIAGKKYGLKPKIHVNQFSVQGGIPVGVQHNAISVDHLEVIDKTDIKALQGSSTISTLLPSCSFFLKIPYAPARELIQANLPVALATDFNPGSTPSGNMQFVWSLACIQMNMTPEEALHAMTINAAAAMEISDTHGSIAIGKKANLIITKPIPSLAYIPYSFGSNVIDQHIINGIVMTK